LNTFLNIVKSKF